MITVLPELDEVEAHPTRGEVREVQAEDYDLPLARALKTVEYDEALSQKAWLDDSLEEVLDVLDLTDEHKDILRSRDLDALKVALAEESEAAGVPKGAVIVWALVRIEG